MYHFTNALNNLTCKKGSHYDGMRWYECYPVLCQVIIVICFLDVYVVNVSELRSRLVSLSGPEGTDSEPRVDFRMDESSDAPILEDRSSSPIDFLHEQWLVGTDIENIERYTSCTCSSNIYSRAVFFLMQRNLYLSTAV